MKTVFLRILEADDKAAALRTAICNSAAARGRLRFEVDTESFALVPGAPFAYWVSERLRRSFKELPPFEAAGRIATVGLQSSDDFRFLRLCWELGNIVGFAAFAKGGQFGSFYADVFLTVRWGDQGREIKAFAEKTPGSNHWSRNIRSADHYFRPGLTWPRRTNGLSLRAMPAKCVFADKGPAAFVENDSSDDLLALAAVTNSRGFALLVSLQLARTELARSYEVGLIQNTPIPHLSPADQSLLATLARRAWSLKRDLDTRTETSHAFSLPALLQIAGDMLSSRATAWAEHVRATEAELAAIQDEIDVRCFDLYGIDEDDRRTITEGLGGGADGSSAPDDTDAESDADDEGDAERNADAASLAVELISWAVGVAFGRFDVRLATDARTLPTSPGPFDPLPPCPPAMLTGDDGLPLASAPDGYPLGFPENGILMDDPGHTRDMTAAVRKVFDVVFTARADAWWNEAAALLDPKNHDLRAWLASSFFEHHLKRYSKSWRKAPILWQIATPSGRYSVWLYAHRLTRDTIFQVQNDVVAPKLAHEQRQLTTLVDGASGSPSAKERKEIAAQETFVEELRAVLDEVKRMAHLWNPTLDDGVVLTMAPLWRLVPQYKPWQQELKGKWHELVAGKYDWAHLAMHLWPDRVVRKCTIDRSLAIAHGLEDVFWVEDFSHRWRVIGSRSEERDYVSKYWADSPRCELLQLARELWEQRYRDLGLGGDLWWQAFEAGNHDDHRLALLLWPERVYVRALDDARFATAHGLTVPEQTAAAIAGADRARENWLRKMAARHAARVEDASFVRGVFASLEGAGTWREWWERLDRGDLDHLPLARHVRSAVISAKCQSDLQLARAHGIERFFFVDHGSGPSVRQEPAAEVSREIAERESPAVKGALMNMMEAPVARTNGRRSRPSAGGAVTS